MKPKEARRLGIMERVLAGKVSIRQAAILLGLSERQVMRLKKGMKQEGEAFLVHKNRGRKPKHAITHDVRDRIISLASEELKDASCEHMAELLEELYEISISGRSLRRIFKQAGIKNRHSRRAKRRKRRSRERMPQEGLLVQSDASPYAWFEDRGPKACLHGNIDDATGKILALWFRPEEDLYGYLMVLNLTVINHGIPVSLYTDGHSIFFSPKKDKLSIDEELAGKTVALTQFGKALEELGINHIQARSPQAKGRIERLWETLQSRLVIEMRLRGISNIEDANAFLPVFIERFNARFAVWAADPEPAFKPAPTSERLNEIIAFREERTASNGSTISFHCKTYQLIDVKDQAVSLAPRAKVTVLTHLDGTISAKYGDKVFSLREFVPQPAPKAEIRQAKPRREPAPVTADHPWRQISPIAPKPSTPVEAYLEAKRKRFRKYAF
ncbi:ISNCY family transposase [Candidatus Desulforudis audaxviator]|uniref:ISNCY family transposase n=1 Tax=Candidatus Desulforudis audaxviator TaxID=471827 RepID=UPI0005A2FB98|nr:ISNCY family transposase [Candidatus Desulforudis audaxviator]